MCCVWTLEMVLQTLCTRLVRNFTCHRNSTRHCSLSVYVRLFFRAKRKELRVSNSRVDVMPNDVQIKILKTQTVTRRRSNTRRRSFFPHQLSRWLKMFKVFHFPSLLLLFTAGALHRTFPCCKSITFAPSEPSCVLCRCSGVDKWENDSLFLRCCVESISPQKFLSYWDTQHYRQC